MTPTDLMWALTFLLCALSLFDSWSLTFQTLMMSSPTHLFTERILFNLFSTYMCVISYSCYLYFTKKNTVIFPLLWLIQQLQINHIQHIISLKMNYSSLNYSLYLLLIHIAINFGSKSMVLEDLTLGLKIWLWLYATILSEI